MKTALIFFRKKDKPFNGDYYSAIIDSFANGGITVDTVDLLSSSDDLGFKRRLEEYKDTADNLIVFDSGELEFDLKEIVSKVMDTPLIENDNARKFLDAVSVADGVEYSDGFALLPVDAVVIPNVRGACQGFIVDDKELTLAVLPDSLKEVKPMCENYVVRYLENKNGLKSRRLILKYFGDKSALVNCLENAKNVSEFKYNLTELHGDVAVNLLFTNEQVEKSSEIIRNLVGELKESIYAEIDSSLGERLFDLLRIKKLKLSVAESFTGGRVVSAVIANSGASEFVHEGVVTYSNQSKIDRLGVVESDLKKQGAVSAVVAYQMAVGLLKSGKCDIAIATTGIAGPKSDDTDKPVGLCYIAVGMKDGVHTYRYNLNGDREEITETAKNTALFLAIKKLKSI